jgi:hypothetical protein
VSGVQRHGFPLSEVLGTNARLAALWACKVLDARSGCWSVQRLLVSSRVAPLANQLKLSRRSSLLHACLRIRDPPTVSLLIAWKRPLGFAAMIRRVPLGAWFNFKRAQDGIACGGRKSLLIAAVLWSRTYSFDHYQRWLGQRAKLKTSRAGECSELAVLARTEAVAAADDDL